MAGALLGLVGIAFGLTGAIAWYRSWATKSAPPQFTKTDLAAIDAAVHAAPPGGWYLWEVARYRETRAPWFDPFRYEGSKLAYPRPTQVELVEGYRGSELAAFNEYGEICDAATWWASERGKADGKFRALHMKQPHPIAWCVERYRAEGEPAVNAPDWWQVTREAKAW